MPIMGAAARGAARDATRADTPAQPSYVFFEADEIGFIKAACDRLIPADHGGPGALGLGVPHYLDRHLAGPWGRGERLYRDGPWQPGSPSAGRLPHPPGPMVHRALAAIGARQRRAGAYFARWPAGRQDDYLRLLAAGAVDLGGVPSAEFFRTLLTLTVEGFFSDPRSGSAPRRLAWSLPAYPGAYAAAALPALQ